jgi:hypothetical protein
MLSLVTLLVGAPGCADDAAGLDEASSECAGSDGLVPECDPAPVAGAEDACWRLVQCGAIPVANPESDPSCCFDWAACVAHVDHLPDQQFELALACVESTTCEEQRAGSSADRAAELPFCLERAAL